LREDGIDALSLRELARQAGVSHGAPRSHVIDRQALLDALAERGFNRLADEAGAVIGSDAVDYKQRFHAAAAAYVHFAVLAAVMQGIAVLVSTRRISTEDSASLIDDAISLLVRE
jgi:AcrR family transcriptional regulator